MKQYVIGDLHGRLDLLQAGLEWVYAQEVGEVIFLGDYIDRGPDNKGVVDLLMAKPPKGWKHTYIRGNHEDMALMAHREWQEHSHLWLINGGMETLEEYGGVELPVKVQNFFNKMPRYIYDEHRIFTHGYVDSSKPLDEQPQEATQWWRPVQKNIDQPEFGRYIVHGHTPIKDGPFIGRHRANLDVGGVWYNRIAIAVFDKDIAGPPIHVEVLSKYLE